jgi:branched-chain amino acid transport system substrate-binding protein
MMKVGECGRWLLAFGASWFLSIHTATAAQMPARSASVEIAAALCMSGDERPVGESAFEGIQLALEDANSEGGAPKLTLKVYDEQSNVEAAKRVAGEIAASDSPVVLGSVFSFLSLVEGPIFAQANISSLALATSDLITQNPTTFRVLFKNSDQGELLANYGSRVLGVKHVAVITIDDGFGRTLKSGFEAAATRLNLDATYYDAKTADETLKFVQSIAGDPNRPAVVLFMLDGPAAPLIAAMRRQGVTQPILGPDAIGQEEIVGRLAKEPEEQRRPGSLIDGVYGTSPVIYDSANAETLVFADRYRARFGHTPSWTATASYEAAKVAAAAIRSVARNGITDPTATRAAVLAYLHSLDSAAHALPGVLGPIWFNTEHGRTLPIRIGRYADAFLDSAPLQIVPVARPSASELAAGTVFEMSMGNYARLQRVVYAGIYLNEISHVDLPRSSFGADFYVWLRFAKNGGGDLDPTDINFPNMLSGSFDRSNPAEQGEMPDGTVYRLWRVQGEFRNEYDLHTFPFDRQRLQLVFFNSRGAADRIVYVLDRRSTLAAEVTGDATPEVRLPAASPTAFTALTQWQALGNTERRENLVTHSALGDPRRLGTEAQRELSGFIATYDVKRLALSTVVKTLMPLLLMTLIIYTTLHFPPVLIKEKVTVAITGALSGAVLLTAINNQLGSIGYTIAIEYAFFVFFGLTTLTIVSALVALHLRHIKRDGLALAIDRGTRGLFALSVFALLAGAWWVSSAPGAGT